MNKSEVPRIEPKEAWEKVQSSQAMLVCAYEDTKRCEDNNLKDAIPYEEFVTIESTLDKDQEIIFYCN